MRFVHAGDFADGLSASLRAGIAALPEQAEAVLVCLGDMPLVTGRVIDRLLAAYDPDEGRTIVVPTYQGKQGNPILWDRRYVPEMMALTGDIGREICCCNSIWKRWPRSRSARTRCCAISIRSNR